MYNQNESYTDSIGDYAGGLSFFSPVHSFTQWKPRTYTLRPSQPDTILYLLNYEQHTKVSDASAHTNHRYLLKVLHRNTKLNHIVKCF